MDLKNLEGTSTYAIEAVYYTYWHLIPEKYRILEKAESTYPEPKHGKKSKPLTYKDVEKEDKKEKEDDKTNEYAIYCDMLNNNKYFDMQPFYDPTGDFDNRLHYKLIGTDFPMRDKVWFVITYNFGNGLLNSSLTRRRFQSAYDTTPSGEKVRFDFINTDLDLSLIIYSNSLQAIFELQENIMIRQREKMCPNTVRSHRILGKFPVSIDTISSSINKLTRDKGTLCALTLNLKIDYPVIGNIVFNPTGVIKEFHTELDSVISVKDMPNMEPGSHVVMQRDIITEDSPTYDIYQE